MEQQNNIFEQVTRKNLLFQATNGMLTVQDVWNLTIPKLEVLGRSLYSKLEDSRAEGTDNPFASNSKPSSEQVDAQLRVDVVLHILNTKKNEADAIKRAAEKKAHNEKILALIAQKQEGKLQNMSEEELRALLQ